MRDGLYLVISAFELSDCAHNQAAKITQSDFRPPRLAGRDERERIVNDPEFDKQIPSDWRRIDKKEKRIYLKWAKRLGSKVKEYRFLYLSHTANHGNFIKPQLYVREDGLIVPYSIDYSAHLCSCCLELFQVVGTAHRKKLVAPCPGAVAFAGLEPDKYLLVES